jgi:small subunit ribosomal protein S5
MQQIDRETHDQAPEVTISDKALHINRVTKVVKGGKRLRFGALVVAGDGNGRVGIGTGKATEVPEAIRKAGVRARKDMITVPRRGTTIYHEIVAHFGASKVLLKPAAPGTGIIASEAIKAVLELAGIGDVLSKSLGSPNRINVVKATIQALASLRDPEKEVALRKGVPESKEGETNA